MSIPDEAVEAAAKAVRESVQPTQAAIVGPYVASEMQARAALEAAAPHLMARAFDEGQKSGMRHAERLVEAAKIGRPELPGPISPNPYRSQA